MKTISITTALLISISAAAFSAEKPAREALKVRAQYVLPGSETREPYSGSLFKISFPSPVLDPSDIVGTASKESDNVIFRNPQQITEEGLTERAFEIMLPEPVTGDPAEISFPEKESRSLLFRDPQSITEEGLSEKAFQISYPAAVIGSPDEIRATELKRMSGK
jgi:hypothetical protein